MDLGTILRAIEIVGPATKAGAELFEGFLALTSGADQVTLRRHYAEARVRSDDLHRQVQAQLGA